MPYNPHWNEDSGYTGDIGNNLDQNSRTYDPNARHDLWFNPNGTLTDWALQDQQSLDLPGIILREQWDDYASRFMPYEDALMNMTHYNNPGMVDEAIGDAMPAVNSAIDTGRQTQQHRLSALGQRPTQETQLRMDEDWDRQGALARTDAANRIRQNIAARSRNIAFGGVGGSAISGLDTQST
ncbi:MAG: hypothetical protein P1P84_02635 [Deferrisomatales bacterium]|nr:hypothetical protein [Deferrisomatales bacterium]